MKDPVKKAKSCDWDPEDFDKVETLYDHILPIARDYFGIIPFIPCVMLNISPQWKDKPGAPIWLNHPGANFGKSSQQTKDLVERFEQVIETYSKSCSRWSACKYIIECGSEGNFCHAHIVLKMCPKTQKSTETHIAKGNHSYEIQKIWNKLVAKPPHEGFVGCLKGNFAIQKIVIRTSEMLADKLAYLNEDSKPEGHKNLLAVCEPTGWGLF